MEPESETLIDVHTAITPRTTARAPLRILFVIIILFFVTAFNMFNGNLGRISELAKGMVPFNYSLPILNKTNSTPPLPPSSPLKTNVTYYELVKDTNYHYEFRFEYNSSYDDNDTRLMILLNGSVRTCIDYWDFAVGRRILAMLHSFRFSILVICSKKRTYDREGLPQKNTDAKLIYTALQKWINDIYYKQFQRYPRLYFHGISRGSKMCSILSRVLPIQHQILTACPVDEPSMLTPSEYPIELQRRLQLDPVFANWFYFDFCYKPTLNKSAVSELCPFQNERHYYKPVPPTYFIHLQNDHLYQLSQFTDLIAKIRKDDLALGGELLNNTEGVKLYVMTPSNITPTYMQETYDTWHSKPYASAFLYEHYVNRSQYESVNKTRQTCQCLPTDLRYYQFHPNITQTWSQQKQDEYKDYANDIQKYIYFFCEDVCGDLYTDHAMTSRHLDKALEWMNKIDSLRKSLLMEDYLNRPLRIWMYEKSSVVTNDTYFASNPPDYVNMTRQYDMYSPEYYLQDYFLQLQTLNGASRRNLQWAANPLLADYFIIPNDLTYYYFYPDVNRMGRTEFDILVKKLNNIYINTMLTNIRTKFPYWSMAKQADQFGSNHILPIVTGRNMGLLYNETQKLLKNVIQVVFTGIRQDMLPPDAPPPRDYRGMIMVYRHGYDVVIPQFTRLLPDGSQSLKIDELVEKKKRVLFFAGALDHTMTPRSARPLLRMLSQDLNSTGKTNITSKMGGKRYEVLAVISGHQKREEYIDSIRSTIFSLCPEGFFPWSPRFFDAVQLGAIPLVLADNIVLPFERFIDWPSISAKVNVSNIRNMIDYIYQIDNFEEYTKKKLTSAQPYADAFKWPYSSIGENGHKKHDFLPDEDKNGTIKNAFHYVSLELRCRRLEQLYGLTSDSFSPQSIDAQKQACTNHPSICPCHDPQRSLAFRQYF